VRKKLFVGALVGVIVALGLAAPAQASSYHTPYASHHRVGTAEVSVFHGIPNTPVDVYVNGVRKLNDFQPGTFAGPWALKAGSYTVAITAATATNASHPVIGPVKLTFARGVNYTIVAHLTAAGAPTATLYRNSTGPTAPTQGRLTVRHTAAAPAVDILAGGTPVISSLTNPNEKVLNLGVGTISAAVALAGTTVPVIGPANVTITRGVDTIVYAWGSAADGTLALAVQTVPTRGYHH
jgi:hypothetical protein